MHLSSAFFFVNNKKYKLELIRIRFGDLIAKG